MNPIVLRSVDRPCDTSRATSSTRPRWNPTAAMIRIACVIKKVTKTGSSTRIDSRTPRRLRMVRMAMAASSIGSFQTSQASGKLLKIASPPAAPEGGQVNT